MTAPAELIAKSNGNGAAIVGGGSALQLLAKQPSPWQKYATILQREFYKPDIDGARAFYGAAAAHKLSGDPVWMFAVAPPSSMKTELILPLRGALGAEIIAKLTPHTFLSGKVGGKVGGDSSLLSRLGSNPLLAFKDFTSILSMRRDDRAELLSDFRELYDGELRKPYGSLSETLEWFGRMTVLAGVTPDLDRYYSVFGSLGERFLIDRFRLADPEETAMAAMDGGDSGARRDRLNNAAVDLFKTIPPDPPAPALTNEQKRAIAKLAVFVTKARTPLIRDGFKRTLEYVPDPENTPRLARQLTQLARGSALLDGRGAINDEDMAIVRRVAFDCAPPLRISILHAIAAGSAPLSGYRIAKLSGQPLGAGYRAIEDMTWLDLVARVGPEPDGEPDDSNSVNLAALDDRPYELTPLSRAVLGGGC